MPAQETDILIIGAGFAGAATAFHLRDRHLGRVVIVEQEASPGVHSSGRNAAIIRDVEVEARIRDLLADGAEFIRAGKLARFERCGLWIAGRGDEPIASRFPLASGRGTWYPACGVVDVDGLLQAYLHGTEVRYNTRVESFEPYDGGLAVRTNHGTLRCRLLVNAAGPWAGRIGGLPLQPLNRTVFCTPPMPAVEPDWPVVWHVNDGLYFRPESGGLLLSVCEEVPADPGDYCEDPARVEELAEKLARLQPALADISIGRQWVGQRTFAADRSFVIGFDPRNEHVFHVAGLGGHGVTSSWAVGRLAADQIERGPRAASPYAPDRLLDGPKP